MSTLWSGRFDAAPDAAAFEWGSSFGFDRRLFEDDVTGSMAWARALASAGILSAGEGRDIEQALAELLEKGRSNPAFVDGSNGNLRLSNTGILDALDLLALQTGNLWQATDRAGISITPDTPKARLAAEPEISKTFYLKNVTTEDGLSEIVTVLQTILNLQMVASDESTDSIVMTATPTMIALVEKIVSDLDRPRR